MNDNTQAATPRTDAEIADDKKRGVCSDPSWVQLACALETELASAQAELTAACERAERYGKQMGIAQAKNQKLREELSAEIEARRALFEQASTLREQVATLERERDQLQANYAALYNAPVSADNQRLISENATLTAKLATLREQHHNLTITNQHISKEKRELAAKLAEVERERDEARAGNVTWNPELYRKVIFERDTALSKLATAEASREQMRKAFGMSEPWPMIEVVSELCEAVRHLRDAHDCDGHGHENYWRALELAEDRYIPALDAALAQISQQS